MQQTQAAAIDQSNESVSVRRCCFRERRRLHLFAALPFAAALKLATAHEGPALSPYASETARFLPKRGCTAVSLRSENSELEVYMQLWS